MDRKVWAGGLASIAAWGLLAGISAASTKLGHPFDLGAFVQPLIHQLWPLVAGASPEPSAQGLLAILIGQALAWALPPSEWDIVKRLNDRLVALAQKSPDVQVSPVLPPQSVDPGMVKTTPSTPVASK